MTGVIKSYDPKHGYGFIAGDYMYHGDLFFHIKDWMTKEEPIVGCPVSFEARKTEKGNKAIRVLRRRTDGK